MTAEPELREVGSGVYAYLQRGSWGYSNAGLVRGGRASLLVDTLYDHALTRRMLTRMERVTGGAAIESVVNTHANGDHCWGNALLSDKKIISSEATAHEMRELPPRLMQVLVASARTISGSSAAQRALRLLARVGIKPAAHLVDAAYFIVEAFGAFDFGAVQLRVPDTTFQGTLELDLGDKLVQLIEVGPAHTRGDVLVHVPGERVIYTGDILFIDSHPIMWAGPVANWIAACDRILALDVDTVVPGHGPITDKQGVREVRDYWVQLKQRAEQARAAGVGVDALAHELASQRSWGEPERLVVNLAALYRELDGQTRAPLPLALLAHMGRFAREHGAAADSGERPAAEHERSVNVV